MGWESDNVYSLFGLHLARFKNSENYYNNVLDSDSIFRYTITCVRENISYARVAQLVERNLAKVEAAGSSPVSRSLFAQKRTSRRMFFFCASRAQESSAPADVRCTCGF